MFGCFSLVARRSKQENRMELVLAAGWEEVACWLDAEE